MAGSDEAQTKALEREASRLSGHGIGESNDKFSAKVRVITASKTKTETNKDGHHFKRVATNTKLVELPVVTIMGRVEDNPFQKEVKRLNNRTPDQVMEEARNGPKDKRVPIMQMRGGVTWVTMNPEQYQAHNQKMANRGDGIFLANLAVVYGATRGKFGGASIKTILAGATVKGGIGVAVNTSAQYIKNDYDISKTNLTQVGVGFVQGALAPDAGLRWQLARSFVATEALNVGTTYIGSRIDGGNNIDSDVKTAAEVTTFSWAVGAAVENVLHVKGAIAAVSAAAAAKKTVPKALVFTRGTKVIKIPFSDDIVKAGQDSAAKKAKAKAAKQAAALQKEWESEISYAAATLGNTSQEAAGALIEENKKLEGQ